MKNSRLSLYVIHLIVFFLYSIITYAQKTVVETDPLSSYNLGVEMYDNEKYGAALEKLTDFLDISDEFLLNSQSEYMIANSSKELNFKNTEFLFLNYVEKYPEQNKSQDVYFQIGKFHFENKAYEKALYWLLKVSNPMQFEVNVAQEYKFMIGYCYYKQKKYEQAIEAFSDLDENKNAYFALANYYKGYIYYTLGSYQKSLDKFLKIKDDEKFIAITPAYISQLYLLLGKNKEALEFGNKALQNDKTARREDILSYVTHAYFNTQDYEKTIEGYKALKQTKYVFTQSDDYCLGYSYFILKKYEDAIEILKQINIEENPFGQNTAFLLGVNYLNNNDKIKARNLFGFAAKLSFDSNLQENASLNFAKLSYDLNFHKDAIISLKDFINKYPQSTRANEAKTLLGSILLATLNYKDAIEMIESIPEKDRNEDINKIYQQISYFYGLEIYQNKNYPKAIELFNKSLTQPINSKYVASSYFWLGECTFLQKNYEGALKQYKLFISLPEAKQTAYYSTGFYNIAYCYLEMENFQEAKIYFEKYAEMEEKETHNERYYDGILRLADCNFALKNYEKALENYNLFITNNYQETDYALFQKSIILGLLNKTDDKLIALQTLKEKYPKSIYAAQAAYEIANVYFLRSDFSGAIEKLTLFTTEYPKSPFIISAYLKIGLAHYNLGKDDIALDELKNLIGQYPYTQEAKEAITVIKNIYIDRGEADKLFEFFNSVPKINLTKSFQDSTLYNSAFSFIKKNDCENAIKSLTSYLESFPKGYFAVNANFYIAACSFNKGDKERSLKNYEVVNDWSPNEFTEKSLLASTEMLYENRLFSKACIRFKQLEDVASNRQNTLISYQGQMRCYYNLNKYDSCIIYSNRIINLSYATEDNKIEAQYYLGKSYYEQKQFDQAIISLRTVYENNEGDLGAEALYITAEIYYFKENYNNALNTIVKLKDDYQNNDLWVAKGFILLSDVFIKINDLFQAQRTLESVIKNSEEEELVILAKKKLQEVKDLQKKVNEEQQYKKSQELKNNESDSIK